MNTGTTEEPWDGDLRGRYADWVSMHGDVQMFPWRPREITRGDILIHRAVRSPGNRLIAVGEVTSDPMPSDHDRWPWQVRRRLLHVCRTLDEAPEILQIGASPLGLRVVKGVDPSAGEKALRLIAAAAGS